MAKLADAADLKSADGKTSCRFEPCFRHSRTCVWSLPACGVLGVWALIQLIGMAGSPETGVSFAAHVGGFVAGVGLALVVYRARGEDASAELGTRQRREAPPDDLDLLLAQ